MSKLSYYLEMLGHVNARKMPPKAWNYLKYRLQRREPHTSVKRCSPQIGAIMVTGRCNLRCGYCSAASLIANSRGRSEFDLTLEKATRILDNPLFARCVLIDLVGGEPLIVKDIVEIVALIHRRGHLVNVATNGLLLSKKIEALKAAGITRINLSLYESNRKVWEKELPQINRVFPVHASLVLLKSALAEPEKIADAVRMAKAAGCLSMRFWMYRPMGVKDAGEVTAADDPALLALRRQLDERYPGFCLWPATVRSAGPVAKRCVQLWQRINVDAKGGVGVCCGSSDGLQGPGSNFFETDPDVLFNHPTLVAMRTNLLDPGAPPLPACSTCNLLGEPGW